jgi:hypothetical protein
MEKIQTFIGYRSFCTDNALTIDANAQKFPDLDKKVRLTLLGILNDYMEANKSRKNNLRIALSSSKDAALMSLRQMPKFSEN